MKVQEEAIIILGRIKNLMTTRKFEEDALEMAIKALEEVEQYRALGTVEELKEAREKQVAIEHHLEEE